MNFKSAQAILDREAVRCRLPDLSATAVGIVKRALSEKEEARERLEDVRDQERRRVGLNTNKTLEWALSDRPLPSALIHGALGAAGGLGGIAGGAVSGVLGSGISNKIDARAMLGRLRKDKGLIGAERRMFREDKDKKDPEDERTFPISRALTSRAFPATLGALGGGAAGLGIAAGMDASPGSTLLAGLGGATLGGGLGFGVGHLGRWIAAHRHRLRQKGMAQQEAYKHKLTDEKPTSPKGWFPVEEQQIRLRRGRKGSTKEAQDEDLATRMSYSSPGETPGPEVNEIREVNRLPYYTHPLLEGTTGRGLIGPPSPGDVKKRVTLERAPTAKMRKESSTPNAIKMAQAPPPPRDLLDPQTVDMDFRPDPNPEDDLDFQYPHAAWEAGRGWVRGGPAVDVANAHREVQEARDRERAEAAEDVERPYPDSASVTPPPATPNAIKMAKVALAGGAATRFGLPALLTQAAALAGITMGAEAIYNMANRAIRSVSQSSRYRKILEANPDLQQADSRKVVDRFRVLDNFGPTISEDPVVAGHWIRQTLEFPTVTPTVLKDVVDVETKMRDASHPLGGGKEIGKGILGHMSRSMTSPGFSFGGD